MNTSPFKTNAQQAVAFAAYKTLEKFFDSEAKKTVLERLPAGSKFDVSNCSITITLPPQSFVERAEGVNKDGIVEKKATQDLYGYATWAIFIKSLKKFNQWKAIRTILIEAMKEVVRRKSKTLKEELQKDDPDLVKEMAELQDTFPISMRKEMTPQMYKTDLPATIVVKA